MRGWGRRSEPLVQYVGFLAWGELARCAVPQRGLYDETELFPSFLQLQNWNHLTKNEINQLDQEKTITWEDRSGSSRRPAPAESTYQERRRASSAGLVNSRKSSTY